MGLSHKTIQPEKVSSLENDLKKDEKNQQYF